MRNSIIGQLLAATISAILPEAASAQSSQDVTISFEPNNQAAITVNGIAPLSRNSHDDLAWSATGTEGSQCSPSDYGRKSSANISASTTALMSERLRLTATLRASAITNGGHYRTCAACDPIGHNCIGIMGHDTRATASASSIVQAKLTFSTAITQSSYDLRFGNSLPSNIKLGVTAPDGTRITPAGPSARIDVKPGDVYYVEARLDVSATDTGGCCNNAANLTGQFDLQVLKAPILASRVGMEPFIAGGKETDAYDNVVALLLNGELHCSGTVVAPNTILTAAHCINGYEDRIAKSEMTYLIGSVITAPTQGPFAVTSGVYPKGGDPFQYNPGNFDHDVGLIYTATAIPVAPAKLHQPNSPPLWPDIVQTKHSLLFVGFGYNTSDQGKLVGAGVKREAPWPTNAADDWRFYFRSKGTNTCKGDSGGPAFYLDDSTRALVVVGVTSEGDGGCTFGDDTRVDSHFAWVNARMH